MLNQCSGFFFLLLYSSSFYHVWIQQSAYKGFSLHAMDYPGDLGQDGAILSAWVNPFSLQFYFVSDKD